MIKAPPPSWAAVGASPTKSHAKNAANKTSARQHFFKEYAMDVSKGSAVDLQRELVSAAPLLVNVLALGLALHPA